MKILYCAALAATLIAAPAGGTDEPPLQRTDAPQVSAYKLILVGDSTMAPLSGWGGSFCAQHVKVSIACLNLARGGRSTRSYRAEGSWDIALGEMKTPGYKAVYVLIQMGHNDQSRRSDRWTEETTEFPENLRRFVREARAAGAQPVLVTPLARRVFKEGRVDNTLASHSAKVREVAAEMNVPLVDLNAASVALLDQLGALASTELAQKPPNAELRAAAERGTTLPLPPAPATPTKESAADAATPPGPRGHVTLKFDYTHLGPKGADLFAQVVARDLAIAVPELAGYVVP